MKSINSKIFLLMLSLLFFSITLKAQTASTGAMSGEVMTNESVITMVKAGLSADIVMSKIQTSKTNFNVSTDELIRLGNMKIPSEIIRAMVLATSSEAVRDSRTGAGDSFKTDLNDPLSAHDAGIYLYEEQDGKKQMTQLEPSISKQTKSGGFLASAVTYGVAKIKFKAALAGQNAKLQISKARPVFYFYFEVKNSGLSTSSYYATSPNEFVLVKMNVNDKSRDVTVSQANAFGAQSGAMDKAMRSFDYEKIAPGVYKVTPNVDLVDGEYGFYNAAGAGPSGGAKIFDFGIKLPR